MAFDDVQELAALVRLTENRRTREASKNALFCILEQLAETSKLLTKHCLCPDEIVHLIHNHDLVGVDVLTTLVEANLKQCAFWQAVLLAQVRVLASGRGVSQGPQRRTGQGLTGEALGEGRAYGVPHVAHVEPALHFQHLPDFFAHGPDLFLWHGSKSGPEVAAHRAPVLCARHTGSVIWPQEAEEISVATGPTQQLHVEVPADRFLWEDGDLWSRIEEVIVEHLYHLARLPRASRMIHQKAGHRRLRVQQEEGALLVWLTIRASGRSVQVGLDLPRGHTCSVHDPSCKLVEVLGTRLRRSSPVSTIVRVFVLLELLSHEILPQARSCFNLSIYLLFSTEIRGFSVGFAFARGIGITVTATARF
mmetsp:Transcript_147627/g.275083  ORF Transcript_147627/g.275083 Transcript_147627/m.275083 type:complete len:364 (-) Transcript_147627:1279-2370(-)